MVERLPVVYVRGYAGTTSGINRQVDDPFYGFNLGSTHVRVGRGGNPVFYQFESPLLRLMIDENYQLLVEGDQRAYLAARPDGAVPPASIWIHRYYDTAASTWGHEPESFDLERAAETLFELIGMLQNKTGAPRVNLVAHSMGGLICRCLIQKVIPDAGKRAVDYVERLFTYGTPHGGIEFALGFGLLERVRDRFVGPDVFGARRMYEYLTPERERQPKGPPKGWNSGEMPENVFPGDRVFCLVGTNPEDYDAAFGMSSKLVGTKSDGLVQIENAYLGNARHAFVHRSHSGRYGMVNSEEGYQNLRRFLFGDLAVQADLVGVRLPPEDETVWQAEVKLAIRGLPIVMHEQLAAHHCPIQLQPAPPGDTADRPLPLVTTYLTTLASRPSDAPMRYMLQLRVLSLRQHDGFFSFDNHLEQTADFDDTLIVDVAQRDGGFAAWARWNSTIPMPLRDYRPEGPPLSDEDPETGTWLAHIALPETWRTTLGAKAAVRLVVSRRT